MQPVSATSELTLPGLDSPDIVTKPDRGHWIERGPQKRLMVFSGRSHTDLAQQIAEQLGVELGEVERSTFANGETYVRYAESIRGADVFIVQTGCEPIDQNLIFEKSKKRWKTSLAMIVARAPLFRRCAAS